MELRFLPSPNNSPAGPPSPSPVNHSPPIVPPHHHLVYSHPHPHHPQQQPPQPQQHHHQQTPPQQSHHLNHHQSHHNMHQLPPQHPNHLLGTTTGGHHHMISRQSPTSPEAHRRTLDRSARNIHHYDAVTPDGMPPSTVRRSNGRVVPGSPRVMRGVSSELLSNRSPMPSRAALAGKRGRLGSRTENMSSGSLNSIEV